MAKVDSDREKARSPSFVEDETHSSCYHVNGINLLKLTVKTFHSRIKQNLVLLIGRLV